MVGVVDTAREEGREQGRQEGWEQGRQEGREQGRQEGWEQGRRDQQLTIAQTLKNAGTSLDFIAQVTGLSLADLQTLE